MTRNVLRFPDRDDRPARPALMATRWYRVIQLAQLRAEQAGRNEDVALFSILADLTAMQIAAARLINPADGRALPSASARRDAYELLVDLAISLPDRALAGLVPTSFFDEPKG